MPKRIIIAAMSHDRIIGDGDRMPWHVPAEYQHFLDSIRGQTMIMGRKSWEIFGADVDTAHNLVVSRSTRRFLKTEVVRSLEDALDLAESYGKTIFIAGGATIYRQVLDNELVDELHLSTIPGDFSGDVRFPEFSKRNWRLAATRQGDGFLFRRYKRNR